VQGKLFLRQQFEIGKTRKGEVRPESIFNPAKADAIHGANTSQNRCLVALRFGGKEFIHRLGVVLGVWLHQQCSGLVAAT
jgi:hypothetical protein